MNELYTYPENDYRYYLMHWGKGGESKNHKYISRKKGSGGKWIYTYAKDAVKGAGNRISNAWDRSSLSKTGKMRRQNAYDVLMNMERTDEYRRRQNGNKLHEVIWKPGVTKQERIDANKKYRKRSNLNKIVSEITSKKIKDFNVKHNKRNEYKPRLLKRSNVGHLLKLHYDPSS